MKISAKSKYAIKAVFELAKRRDSAKPVTVEQIAEAQGIPKKFLVQLLFRLGQGGLVESVRGSGGGFLLLGHPAKITLYDIFRIVDKGVVQDEAPGKAQRLSPAEGALALVWNRVNKSVVDVLQMTVEEFVSSAIPEPIDYQI